jgi:hypothetical protein
MKSRDRAIQLKSSTTKLQQEGTKSSLSVKFRRRAIYNIPAWLAGTKAEAEAARARRARIRFIMVQLA